ncbi:site-specific integrase [Clostridium perfringens]|nr:site-specific integrase [Clostridium perfringens]HAT4113032.1 site-specific integrase [Clostridium perfringens]
MIFYKYKEQEIIDFNAKKPKKIREVIIIKYDKDKDVWIPSPLSHFIYHRHTANNHSNNTKIQTATSICDFINYLIKSVELDEDESFRCLKDSGLSALNIFHLAKYLNHISNKSNRSLSYETVKKKELNLIQFYSYLYDREITSGKDAEIPKKVDSYGNLVPASPFKYRGDITIKYPTKDGTSKVLKDMKEDVWNRFLQYAYEHYPNIALGVAMQAMGGLRMGEVVNLRMDSINEMREKNYITVDIEDRQNDLFNRNINTRKMQVKKPRFNQPVFNFNGRLFEFLDSHIESVLKRTNRVHEQALFIDSKGQPMSGDSYMEYFKSLKNDFIEFLYDNGFATTAKELETYTWGTHIGRHIFTNHLLRIDAVSNSEGDPVAKYLMTLRGDSSERSANEYIDTRAVIEIVTEKISTISECALL